MVFYRKSPSKFGSIKQTYNGYNYDSKKEAEYAAELDWRIKAGEITAWTRQHKLELRVNGQLICKYYVDFAVELPDGTIEFHEVKGYETDVWRIKWKLSQALFPDSKFVLVK
jgi:hypothetical protein